MDKLEQKVKKVLLNQPVISENTQKWLDAFAILLEKGLAKQKETIIPTAIEKREQKSLNNRKFY